MNVRDIKKAQSAIEYLMTYGWMLLVVAIVGGAIFSMVGDQNIEGVQGFDSSTAEITDFGVSEDNGLEFVMSDPIGQTNIVKIEASDSKNNTLTYEINQDLSSESVVSLPGINPSSENEQINLGITYDESNLENLIATGQVSGSIEINSEFQDREIILDGLVGYWPLTTTYSDEQRAYDVSGNRNHGELNTPRFNEDGEMHFDWGDDVTLPSGEDFEPNIIFEDMTVATWVNVEDLGTTNHSGIFNTAQGNEGRIHWEFREEEIRLRMEDFDERTEHPVEAGEWTHIAYSYNHGENRVEMFANGEKFFENANVDSGGVTLSGSVRIGRNCCDREFKGEIQDFHIYERALSAREINKIHSNSNLS